MNHTLFTVIKMAVPTGAGVVVTYTEAEAYIRMGSIFITTGLAIAVFIRDNKRRRNEKKDS